TDPALGGWPRARVARGIRPAAGAPPRASPAARPQSVSELLEQARLEVGGAHPPRCRDQRLDLAPTHEPPPTKLDALDLARPGPAPDGRRPEAHVGGGENPRRLL